MISVHRFRLAHQKWRIALMKWHVTGRAEKQKVRKRVPKRTSFRIDGSAKSGLLSSGSLGPPRGGDKESESLAQQALLPRSQQMAPGLSCALARSPPLQTQGFCGLGGRLRGGARCPPPPPQHRAASLPGVSPTLGTQRPATGGRPGTRAEAGSREVRRKSKRKRRRRRRAGAAPAQPEPVRSARKTYSPRPAQLSPPSPTPSAFT